MNFTEQYDFNKNLKFIWKGLFPKLKFIWKGLFAKLKLIWKGLFPKLKFMWEGLFPKLKLFWNGLFSLWDSIHFCNQNKTHIMQAFMIKICLFAVMHFDLLFFFHDIFEEWDCPEFCWMVLQFNYKICYKILSNNNLLFQLITLISRRNKDL